MRRDNMLVLLCLPVFCSTDKRGLNALLLVFVLLRTARRSGTCTLPNRVMVMRMNVWSD